MTAAGVHFGGKVAVLVLDGFGLKPETELAICDEVWRQLPEEARSRLLGTGAGQAWLAASLAPTFHGVAAALSAARGIPSSAALSDIRLARTAAVAALGESRLTDLTARPRMETAARLHYVPWSVSTPFLFSLRQSYPTWPTRTAGLYTGFAEMDPEIMGNSDTGHQQIFNLAVARQVPTFITDMIRDGSFFGIEDLNRDLRRAGEGWTVVFKTLLSGEFGDDGYVHSAWSHIPPFLDLYFRKLGLPAERLQIEAVLDGRDSPYCSSLRTEMKDGRERYGFLPKLRHLLAGYGAETCLRWVIGRQHMDRDYKGNMIRKEYELVTANAGRRAGSLDEAFALVAADHAAGLTDAQIPPICIGQPVPVGERTVFFNAIFRADRQEPITAALLAATDFIRKQAGEKGRLESWDDLAWIRRFDSLRMWCMIDYHAALAAAGARCMFKDRPHEHNVLHLLTERFPEFRFLFTTEGVKEKHMGLFSRGRRSLPLASEVRDMERSYGKEHGVFSDDDLYKVPFMRHFEIACKLLRHLASGQFDLLAANFPGADMIGHLVGNHFDACQQAVLSLDAVLRLVVPAAQANGWLLVVTSDHGNVEHYAPDHGNNDVLTTVMVPEGGGLVPQPPPADQARLFDIAWTILAAFGLSVDDLNAPPIPSLIADDPRRLVGVPLVRR